MLHLCYSVACTHYCQQQSDTHCSHYSHYTISHSTAGRRLCGDIQPEGIPKKVGRVTAQQGVILAETCFGLVERGVLLKCWWMSTSLLSTSLLSQALLQMAYLIYVLVNTVLLWLASASSHLVAINFWMPPFSWTPVVLVMSSWSLCHVCNKGLFAAVKME